MAKPKPKSKYAKSKARPIGKTFVAVFTEKKKSAREKKKASDYQRYKDPQLHEKSIKNLNLEDFARPALPNVSTPTLIVRALEEITAEKKARKHMMTTKNIVKEPEEKAKEEPPHPKDHKKEDPKASEPATRRRKPSPSRFSRKTSSGRPAARTPRAPTPRPPATFPPPRPPRRRSARLPPPGRANLPSCPPSLNAARPTTRRRSG